MADTLIAWLHPNEISATFDDCKTSLLGWDMTHSRRIGPYARVRCASGGIPEGRNQVAGEFLAEDVEWLFMVDSDMGFAPDVLDRLHAAADPVDRPIVGGLCFAHREVARDGMGGFRCEARPTIYDWVEHPDGHRRFTGRAHYPVDTLTECAATGAACLLIHRSVIERLHSDHGPHWFDRVRGSDGSLLGEDISFFVRTAAAGIPCHVHTGIRTTHFKNIWLGETDFWGQYQPPPALERTAVIVPVLGRPEHARPFMESLRASTGLATVYAAVSDLADVSAWSDAGAEVMFDSSRVTFAEKVNTVFDKTSEPWVFLVGSDVRFRAGWLDHTQHIADRYQAAVVGTNDLGNPRVVAGEHATHMLISRAYVDVQGASWDGPGVVCHEGYRHWFVDDEIVTAAKRRGVWAMALGSVVEHLHPAWGKAADDDVYRLGESHAAEDHATFRRRSKRVMAGA